MKIITIFCVPILFTATISAATSPPRTVELIFPSNSQTTENATTPVEKSRSNNIVPPRPQPSIAPSDNPALSGIREQMSSYGKEIDTLKEQLAANSAALKVLTEKISHQNGQNKSQMDPQVDYEKLLAKNGEDVFLMGVGKARMARLDNGQVAFRVPRESASKATNLLGAGVIAWYNAKDSVYFITTGSSVKQN